MAGARPATTVLEVVFRGSWKEDPPDDYSDL